MTLLEILDQLPAAKAAQLERLLDHAPIPEEPSRNEVLRAVRVIVDQLAVDEPPEVIELLNQTPEAVLKHLAI